MIRQGTCECARRAPCSTKSIGEAKLSALLHDERRQHDVRQVGSLRLLHDFRILLDSRAQFSILYSGFQARLTETFRRHKTCTSPLRITPTVYSVCTVDCSGAVALLCKGFLWRPLFGNVDFQDGAFGRHELKAQQLHEE